MHQWLLAERRAPALRGSICQDRAELELCAPPLPTHYFTDDLCLLPKVNGIMRQGLKTLDSIPSETLPPRAAVREIISLNPSTLDELGRVPIFTAEQVQQAL